MQTPYEHQIRGMDLLRKHPRYALFWDMGTGKTLPTIQVADERMRDKDITLVLIIGPKVSLWNWLRELKENSEYLDNIFILEGQPKERNDMLRGLLGLDATTLIANYSKLRLHESQLAHLVENNKTMMVFDESQYIKSARAKRTQVAIRLADKAKYVVLLTGTPVGKNVGDIWSQYRCLDGGATFGISWYRFRHTYMTEQPHVRGMYLEKKGAAATVRRKMWRLAQSLRKEDCLDLPEKRFSTWDVAMPAGMMKLYTELATRLIAEYENEEEWSRVKAINAGVAVMKLQQITSGFFIDERGKTVELEWQPKLETLAEIAEEICPNEKLVVWARFKRDVARIIERLAEYNVLSIEARHSAEERAHTCELFNEDNDKRVLVSNPASGGVAINLIGGSTAVYYNNSYDYIHRVQSQDRIHRIGQTRKVMYIDLVVPGTIDEGVLAVLSRKDGLVKYLQHTGNLRDIIMPEGRDKDVRNREWWRVNGSATSEAQLGHVGPGLPGGAGRPNRRNRSTEGDGKAKKGPGRTDSLPTLDAWW